MDKLRNKLDILLVAYDEIASTYDDKAINTQVNNIKSSIKELNETLNLLNKLGKHYE